MDLIFSEEQNILRDMVGSLCEKYSSVDTVRAMENDPSGVDQELWQQMKETGILSMRLPEEYGGMGLNMVDCAVVYEELGRGLAPGPHFVSGVMAVSAIEKAGSDEQKSELLPALGAGDLIMTPAWLEPDNSYGPQGVQMRAAPSAEGYRLNGVKRHVFFASAADKLLVLARTGDDVDAIDLFVVARDAQGVELEQQLSMASDTQYKVTFNNVVVSAADRLGAEHSGWAHWQQCMYEGIILLAAQATGGAEKALKITANYSKERHQFDKPLAAFQSLSHYMADAFTVIEGAKVLVLEAAWNHAEGRSIERLAPMAKLAACNAFRDTTAKCEQIHGGYGFTLEYDIQLYFRRAKQLQLNWWDTRYLEDLIAAAVLDQEGERTIPDPFTL
jgi:alkylation response protein AidB-like acyl-CoA dehydrogenase